MHIHLHIHYDDKVLQSINSLTQKIDNMAAGVKELKELALELKGIIVTLTDVVNTEQEQVAIALQKLGDIIVNGGTEEERQEIFDILTSAKVVAGEAIADIKSTIPDTE